MSIPKPPLRLKAAPTGRTGAVTGQRSVTLKAKDGSQIVEHDKSFSKTIPSELAKDKTGMAGVGMGLTIPGPEKSYMTARIDAYCYLPCVPTAAGVRQAMAEAADLVQEQIDADSQQIAEFFKGIKR